MDRTQPDPRRTAGAPTLSRRRMLALLGAGALGGVLSACSNDSKVPRDAEQQMVIAHTLPTTHVNHRSYEMFADMVMAGTNGRIAARVFPNAVFGADRQLVEAIQMNNIHVTAPSSSPVGAFSSPMNMWDVPYLFASREEAYEVLDGSLGQDVLRALDEANLVGLSYWENGFRNLTHNRNGLEMPNGLAGLKLRTQENALQIRAWGATGANTTPMAFTEVYTGLQQGTIDAQENPLALIVAQRFYEVQKYLLMSRHVYGPMPLIISKRFFEGLAPNEQQLVREAAIEAGAFCRAGALDDEQRAREVIEGAGVEVRDTTDKENSDSAEVMRSAAEPLLAEIIGPEFMSKYRKVFG